MRYRDLIEQKSRSIITIKTILNIMRTKHFTIWVSYILSNITACSFHQKDYMYHSGHTNDGFTNDRCMESNDNSYVSSCENNSYDTDDKKEKKCLLKEAEKKRQAKKTRNKKVRTGGKYIVSGIIATIRPDLLVSFWIGQAIGKIVKKEIDKNKAKKSKKEAQDKNHLRSSKIKYKSIDEE